MRNIDHMLTAKSAVLMLATFPMISDHMMRVAILDIKLKIPES